VREHFSSPQWVDLVRGQLTEEVATEMDRHLRAGCTECVAAFDAWQGLALFVAEERALTPPADAVRVAKSYLAQRTFAAPLATPSYPIVSWASATLGTLVFDSHQAAPAGVRAAATFSRHVVFDAESLAIDLHIETGTRAGWFLLSGQIVDRHNPVRSVENLWLSLVDDRQEISSFQTNQLGEFKCTFDYRRALKLMVYAGRDVVALPIETLLNPGPHSSR
jgi:hypothetical protein